MRIAVCVKQVALPSDEIEFTDDGAAIDPDFLDRGLNEWDAYAIEAALQLRETHGGEVTAITVGDEEAEDVLRRALAMGADAAVRVDAETGLDALAPARALATYLADERHDLVLCGAQSADAANASTPAALAALLDTPCVAVACAIALDGAAAVVHRELEGGLVDVVEVDLPAVVSMQTGSNSPRYAALRAIRQAEEREIAVHRPDEHEPMTRIARLEVTQHDGATTMLEGSPSEIAGRILALVKERIA